MVPPADDRGEQKDEQIPSLSAVDTAPTAEESISPVQESPMSEDQVQGAMRASNDSALTVSATPGPTQAHCDGAQSSGSASTGVGSGTALTASPAACGEKPGNPEGQSLLGLFMGKAEIEGSRSDPEEAVAQARHIESHHSTLDDIMLGYYVDASYDDQTGRGAYSVVYKHFAPGEEDDGKIVMMGWPMDPAVDNVVAEILAVVSAMSSDLQRLSQRPALVCIFSDHTTPHNFAANPRGTLATKPHSLRHQIYRRMFASSRELAAIPGLQTEHELLWLPSHMVGNKVDLHEMADKHSTWVRKEQRPICLVGGVEVELEVEEGMYWELRDAFVRRTARVPPARGLKRFKREREAEDMDKEKQRVHGSLSLEDELEEGEIVEELEEGEVVEERRIVSVGREKPLGRERQPEYGRLSYDDEVEVERSVVIRVKRRKMTRYW
ncbi:hypothetical protein QBC39DRAFT_403281 [Podospora conica]|nr:hypothetical protein QBC39DRAFT_403281 [Schizothecium conicum]